MKREELERGSLEQAVDNRRLARDLSTEKYGNRLAAERLARFGPIYDELRLAVRMMQSTKFWKLRQAWFALKKRLKLSHVGPAPVLDPPPIDDFIPCFQNYDRWRLQHDYRPADGAWMRAAVNGLRVRPSFSLIVPTYNTPESYLRDMLDSVLLQVYPDWEMCIADDGSTSPHVRAVLDKYASDDSRIRVLYRSSNGHICAASNSALAMATGDFIGLLDHDDVLSPDALFQNALVVNAHNDVDMIYSDEDKIDDEGARFNAYFKPDWSPDTLLSRMYTSHFSVYRTALVKEIGGFRTGFEGSQDYDLALRLTEMTSKVEHIPRVLYHWRVHAASTTLGMGVKPYAATAAVRALNEALERRGEPGNVRPMAEAQGTYTIRYHVARRGKVSIIIAPRDGAANVDRCLNSLFEKTSYADFEVLLVDNGKTQANTRRMFATWQQREPLRFRIVRHDGLFNHSQSNNVAAAQADGDYFLFLHNDTEITHADWMLGMVEHAQRKSIGAVGAKLLYADGRIQHAGVIIGIGGIAGYSHRFSPGGSFGYFNQLCAVSNFSAVTAACMMLRRDVFESVGGFDEGLTVAYNDVDLCLKIIKKDYRIVYLPHVVLYNLESQSRDYDLSREQTERHREERNFIENRWLISAHPDPYYNINLTLLTEDYSLAPLTIRHGWHCEKRSDRNTPERTYG